jgi:hypothetical protein
MEHKLPLALLVFEKLGVGIPIGFESHENSFGRIPKVLVGQDASDSLKKIGLE